MDEKEIVMCIVVCIVVYFVFFKNQSKFKQNKRVTNEPFNNQSVSNKCRERFQASIEQVKKSLTSVNKTNTALTNVVAILKSCGN